MHLMLSVHANTNTNTSSTPALMLSCSRHTKTQPLACSALVLLLQAFRHRCNHLISVSTVHRRCVFIAVFYLTKNTVITPLHSGRSALSCTTSIGPAQYMREEMLTPSPPPNWGQQFALAPEPDAGEMEFKDEVRGPFGWYHLARVHVYMYSSMYVSYYACVAVVCLMLLAGLLRAWVVRGPFGLVSCPCACMYMCYHIMHA